MGQWQGHDLNGLIYSLCRLGKGTQLEGMCGYMILSRYLKTLPGNQDEIGSPAATSFPPTQSHRGRNCSQSTPKSKPKRSSTGIFGLNVWGADGCRPFLVSMQE